jgi:hypothetical protein
MWKLDNWVPGLPLYPESNLPGVDNNLVIHSYPDVKREDRILTEQERYYRKLARKARRAKRPWWLRWY